MGTRPLSLIWASPQSTETGQPLLLRLWSIFLHHKGPGRIRMTQYRCCTNSSFEFASSAARVHWSFLVSDLSREVNGDASELKFQIDNLKKFANPRNLWRSHVVHRTGYTMTAIILHLIFMPFGLIIYPRKEMVETWNKHFSPLT